MKNHKFLLCESIVLSDYRVFAPFVLLYIIIEQKRKYYVKDKYKIIIYYMNNNNLGIFTIRIKFK